MYRYYCTHGCVCQLVIKENGGDGGGGSVCFITKLVQNELCVEKYSGVQ